MTQTTEVPTNHSLQSVRDALEQAERQIGRLDRSNITAFLVALDRIEQMFTGSQDKDAIRAEEVRWESLRQRLSANPGLVVSAAADAGGLNKLRSQYATAAGPWWYLDAEVTRRRTQTMKRAGLAIGAIIVVTLIVWGVMTFFPTTNALTNTSSAVEQLVTAQQWPEALALVKQANQTSPADPDLLVWEAVLQEQLGNTAQAQTTLAQAQQTFVGQPAAFWTLVGNHRQQADNLLGAEAAGQQALALAPQDAQVTFLLGSVAEARGDMVQAAAYFSQTVALAEDSDSQLGVVAKVRMGNLMQHVEPMPNPAPAETITATMTPKST